ncbi:hypothetical protein PISMIDRAFT_16572 [Pisolithus microcarpus 441]|uniref:Uncharacterized protein n=1 Tax=Pisolithus microcarpus 441 TaxID=765257 RepID=A0A0C9YN82_9AGAM|nr:hypothetical protein PISMIDRAFT_16572 [Pisolithus microcarpus 441]
MGWEASKEELGPMAQLEGIPSHHGQEQDLEMTKEGIELIEVFMNILNWLNLRVLEGYEGLEVLPIPSLED